MSTLADCTLARIMFFARGPHRAAVVPALASLIFAGIGPFCLRAQTASTAAPASAEPATTALPIAEDRGEADLEQTLKRLGTTASMLVIVAHPDDEDGALMTYLARGMGARVALLTLTRGEGGQNLMSADTEDALGLLRTNELLKADEYYGATELWGTEVDFGFSKTQQESFSQWGHERVLYDAVLAVRKVHPQIIMSTFVGGITDGHGQHQVSGEIAQEVFKAAADPRVFPDQLKPVSEGGLGLQPWQPLAVYSRTPFAPVTSKGMFDYATGKWAPARFLNYITGEWTTGVLSTDATIPVGNYDFTLGRTYAQIARQGWGMQKSQNGGANPELAEAVTGSYHLWGVAPEAKATGAGEDNSLFHNQKVSIDTSIAGLARLVPGAAPGWLTSGLEQIDFGLKNFDSKCPCHPDPATADALAPIYKQTLDLRSRVAASDLDSTAKADLLFELDQKIEQFQTSFKNMLGLSLTAFRTNETRAQNGGFRGSTADETPRSISPGEAFRVRVHTSQATPETRLDKVWLDSQIGSPWKSDLATAPIDPSSPVSDPIFAVTVPDNADPTEPYFTRPNIEQAYYNISNPAWRERSFAPYPLAAWAEFTFDGLPIRLGEVVQTLDRVTGPGGIYEPLVVAPAIGVRVEPEARILPLNGGPLPVQVTVHTQGASSGVVKLNLPDGWTSQPAEAQFRRISAGDTEPILFSVSPSAVQEGAYSVRAVAVSAGREYKSGWKSIGYPGLRPYNQYKPAELRTRKVNLRVAPGLHLGYVMGTGDLVPQALEGMGITPHLLSDADLESGDLSQWNVIVIGIRAYSVRPQLAAAQGRLNDFVRAGGTLVVQYQSSDFPAPLSLSMNPRMPERVVDEDAPVKLLDPANPLLSWPNKITPADFEGWVEERGHSFMETWDPGFTALTETADPGQDPQKGGLLVAHPGKGTYVYVAYALYRQLPELVPGSYRLLANLLSAGKGNNAQP
ncbi:MAG TPA: PIG-L family deacetylase [Terracidiphilus sp.]|nr:PIG-L family deacetylase [Terracidiphilus sp.]